MARKCGRLSETCNGEEESYSLPDPQSFMMKNVPLATVRMLNARDGAGTSPRFLTSRANMMQRCWNQ